MLLAYKNFELFENLLLYCCFYALIFSQKIQINIYLCNMKKAVLPLFFIILLFSCSQYDSLKTIDCILEKPEAYERVFRRQVDSLTEQFSNAPNDSMRFSSAWSLYEKYKVYNIDTCLQYARVMQEVATSQEESIISRSAMVYALSCIGNIEDALAIYKGIPDDFPFDERFYIYYESAHHLFLSMGELNSGIRDSCALVRHLIREQLLQRDSTSYFSQTYLVYEARYNKKIEEAVRIASSILNRTDIPSRYRSINEDNLGRLLLSLGREDEAIEHIAQSAILDLTSASKEYNSLYALAKILYRRGYSERACRYMVRTMNDAIFCNYKSHSRRSAGATLLINQAFLKESALKRHRQIELIIVLGLLLGLTVVILLLRQIYAQKEKAANERIRRINIHLKDGNNIRDNILSDYMEKTTYYIRKVDEMKSEMRRTYRRNGQEALLSMLRSPAYSDTEFKVFFHEFDQSILRMFPNFIDEVNKLTADGHKYSFGKNGSFNTELRILAIIRMGITDSEKIAQALNISIGTTYSYRYRMRHNAICPPEEFENRIREIGLY